MAYGVSNGHVTSWSRDRWRHVTPKSQTHDPNTLKAQYLENSWRCYLATIANYYIVCWEAVRSAILATAWQPWLLVVNANFKIYDHVIKISCPCSKRIYLLKQSKSQGLGPGTTHLHVVFTVLIWVTHTSCSSWSRRLLEVLNHQQNWCT